MNSTYLEMLLIELKNTKNNKDGDGIHDYKAQ